MRWLTTTFRVLIGVAAGALLGWYFDHAVAGVILALLAVLLFWSHQMWHLQQWLGDSSQPPPDLYGIWGETVSRIYKDQRDAEESSRRLQSTVDYLLESFASMRDGVVIVEKGGGIKWCNKAATALLGLRYPEDTGQAVTNLVRQPAFSRYFNAGQFDEPLQFQTGGEENLDLQVIVTRFASDDRLIFVRDVSALVRVEQIRRDFVGNVSHELRTPLTVISGYVDTFLADHNNLPPAYVKPMQQMAQQAERMESLLKDLLWLSRIESEEKIGKHEQIDVAALLDELREELRNIFPDRELQLQVESRCRISGDYRELYSAVSNLVQNAFKYSGGDSPVTIRCSRAGGECLLAVADEGVGIEPAHIGRLTERFYRVDDSRNSSTGGTGLGLAIVKHVAIAHGGRLTIASEPGRGSTFTLRLPLSE